MRVYPALKQLAVNNRGCLHRVSERLAVYGCSRPIPLVGVGYPHKRVLSPPADVCSHKPGGHKALPYESVKTECQIGHKSFSYLV